MELIRKIKEAESQAKKIVEEADKNAAQTETKSVKQRQERLEAAAQQRKMQVAEASENGKNHGKTLAEQMRERDSADMQKLKESANKKTDSAAVKVVDFIKAQAKQK